MQLLQPFDVPVAHDEYVETHAAAAQLRPALQEQRRGGGDAPLLAAADARRGAAELFAGARAHLGDHQQFAGARDHVDLTDAPQEIAGDDGEPLRFEECGRAVFCQRSGLTAIHAALRVVSYEAGVAAVSRPDRAASARHS